MEMDSAAASERSYLVQADNRHPHREMVSFLFLFINTFCVKPYLVTIADSLMLGKECFLLSPDLAPCKMFAITFLSFVQHKKV